MGSIKIEVAGGVVGAAKSKTYTVPDADVNRLVEYLRAAYATVPTTVVPNPPVLTPAQALVAWADGLIAGTKANVVSHERDIARKALPEPPPIVAT